MQSMRNPLKLELMSKKGNVVGEVIAIFIVIFIISVLAGMTFLFTGIFKQQIANTAVGNTSSTAYQAVNNTEQSGFQTTQFLTILFLAMMFSAIMAVVLRVVLPFMNVGGAMGF